MRDDESFVRVRWSSLGACWQVLRGETVVSTGHRTRPVAELEARLWQ